MRPVSGNVPKRAKTTTEIRLKVGNNFILQISKIYIFLIPYHSFTFVRSFKAFSSPCASGELLKTQLSFVVYLEDSIENPLTLNNARFRELLIFSFSQKIVLEVRAL